jgi:hypothetical protein
MPKPGWSRRRNGVLRDECTTVGGWCPAGVPALTTQPPDFLRVCVVSCMGEVVHLAQVRGRGDRAARWRGAAPAFFYFDLACPFSYLAAERVERLFARVVWRPALGDGATAATRGRTRCAPRRPTRRPSAAPPSCACRWCGPRGAARRRARRCRPCGWRRSRPSTAALPRSRLPRGGCSGAAASSSTIARSWPRPPRPPGWAWRTRCTRAVTWGATAPWRPSRAACWPPAPTGCRPWLPGGRVFAGELQLDEAAAAARSHPRSAAGGIPA